MPPKNRIKTDLIKNLQISLVFIWIGFVCAISFMEAWLKFKAVGVTLQIGLGIGQLVFGALNFVEIIIASLILSGAYLKKRIDRKQKNFNLFLIPLFILLIQTFWVLPVLDDRATQIINGSTLEKSYWHTLYIVLEIIKFLSLLLFGKTLFKSK